MATPGTKPKPIEQRRKEGTLRARHKTKTPMVMGGRARPEEPQGLGGDALEAWRWLVDTLWDSGVLDLADAPLIEGCAVQLGRAREAARDIAERGQMVTVIRGKYNSGPGYESFEPNPSLRVEREAWVQVRQLCEQLGIGPSARARLAGLGVQGRGPDVELPAVGKLRALSGGA